MRALADTVSFKDIQRFLWQIVLDIFPAFGIRNRKKGDPATGYVCQRNGRKGFLQKKSFAVSAFRPFGLANFGSFEFTTFASNPHTTIVTLFVAKNLALETPLMPTEIGSQICTHLQECWVVISTVSFFPKAVVSGTLFIISPHSIRDSSWPQALYYERCGIRTAKKLRGSIKSKVGFHSPHCRWTHVRLDIPCKLQWAQ